MAKKKPAEVHRLFNGAEAGIAHVPTDDADWTPGLRVRFMAIVITETRTLEHADAPWVLMKLDDAEQLAALLTKMVREVRSMKPGADLPDTMH